jgi:phage terminase large subunit-like protein
MSLTSSFLLDNISLHTLRLMVLRITAAFYGIMLTFTPVHELDGVVFVFDVHNKQVLPI